MDVHTGQQRRFPAVAIVVVLFILCVTPGQYLIAKQFPTISGLAQINPSVVFLDIPVYLPIPIDLILAPGLFLLIYPLVVLLYPFGPRRPLQRVRAAFTGLFVLLCCILSGALIYYLVQDHLTTQVRTGINSIGINADIHLAYPGYETIPLRGSLILLVCFIIGLLICIRKIRKQPVSGLTRAQRMTPYERMLQEKRMGKHMIKEARQIQKKTEEYEIDNRIPAPLEQQTIQGDRLFPSRVCYSKPVITLKPEAVYYMPV